MLAALLFYIFLGVLCSSLSCMLYYRWQDTFLNDMKGPFCLPFIGVLYYFRDAKAMFQVITNLVQKYGKTFKSYILFDVYIKTSDPDFIEYLATSNKTINKGMGYKFLLNWLGTGLLTSSREKWRQRRKLITPAYHFKVLDQFIETFDRNGNIMIEKLQGELNKPQTDIYPFVNLCALDTICETAMGTKVNAQTSPDSEFVNATKFMSGITYTRGFNIFKYMDWSYPLTDSYRTEMESLKVLHGYTLNLIKSRRNELIAGSDQPLGQSNPDDEFGCKRKDNFLDVLLKSSIDGQPLSDEDIREEVDTFTFEGHDTVSSGISFALYALSNHPDIQERVLDEQRQIFGSDPHRATTLSDLQEMNYLEMVIKETLRLYPSVPLINRLVTETVEYKNMVLKPGTQIVIGIYTVHKDPDFFPNPEVFDPERFTAENCIGRHPFCYIPFSAGHRNCIGQKFAMLEMKSTISKVFRNYELLPLVPKHVPSFHPEIVLRAYNGVLMKFKRRQW